MRLGRLLAIGLAFALGSCASASAKRRAPQLPASDPAAMAGLSYNWPLPADEARRLLAGEDFEIRSESDAGGGVTGAKKWNLFFPARGLELKVKWKPVPRGLDSWNNSPRKELAAYAVQFWFLDADELIVPTTVLRCIPTPAYAVHHPDARPTIDGTGCVLGVLSLWLQNVEVPPVFYEETRFRADAAYAHHMANFNLFAYLTNHRDARSGNLLTSKDASNRRVFAVDNGISFGSWIYNFLVRNWNDIRVPALRRSAVERLRRLSERDLQSLGVVAEVRPDERGVLREVEPGANLDESDGVRVRPGVVQLGLTEEEIDDVAERIEDLIEDADEDDIALF